MQQAIQGTVTSIDSKTITIKNGPRAGGQATIFYVTIDGQHRVNVGFACPFEDGEYVTIMAEQKFGELKMVGKGAGNGGTKAPAQAKPVAKATAPAQAAFPVPQGTKDISIIRQNSLGHATRLMDTLISHGFINTKGMTEEQAVEKTLAIAMAFADFSSGHREVKMASELAKHLAHMSLKEIEENE